MNPQTYGLDQPTNVWHARPSYKINRSLMTLKKFPFTSSRPSAVNSDQSNTHTRYNGHTFWSFEECTKTF